MNCLSARFKDDICLQSDLQLVSLTKRPLITNIPDGALL